jgi:hypothetical protein
MKIPQSRSENRIEQSALSRDTGSPRLPGRQPDPAGAVVDVLHSWVAGDPDWGRRSRPWRTASPRPRLVNRWPLPDLADPAMRRVLTGHTG